MKKSTDTRPEKQPENPAVFKNGASDRSFAKRSASSGKKAAAAAALLAGVLCIYGLSRHHLAASSLKEGRDYLQSLAGRDPGALQSQLDVRHLEQARARLGQGGPASQNVWPLFTNAMILGDSRALGFQEYDYLPDANVVAEIGYGVRNVKDSVDEIAARQPEVIYISFGVNDVENGIGAGDGEYGKLFKEAVDQILEKSPNSTIVVNSILDVTEPVKAATPRLQNIAQYNAQLAQICQENGWIYVDNGALAADPSIYEGDGIHFVSSFYERWARNMLSGYFNNALKTAGTS